MSSSDDCLVLWLHCPSADSLEWKKKKESFNQFIFRNISHYWLKNTGNANAPRIEFAICGLLTETLGGVWRRHLEQ